MDTPGFSCDCWTHQFNVARRERRCDSRELVYLWHDLQEHRRVEVAKLPRDLACVQLCLKTTHFRTHTKPFPTSSHVHKISEHTRGMRVAICPC